ncbi:MAG: type II CAAX prenyl endopeptidase Rce1 family protein [Planctomycetaceae bacterium]
MEPSDPLAPYSIATGGEPAGGGADEGGTSVGSAPMAAASDDILPAVIVPPDGVAAPPPKVWPVPLILVISFLFYLVASVLAVALAAFAVHGHLSPAMFSEPDAMQKITQSRIGFPLIVMIPQIAMIIPALVAAGASSMGLRRRLGLVRGQWPLWAWVTAALATPLIGMISSAIVGLFMQDSESLLEMSHIFRDLADEGFLIPLALLIGATPGICEELLFRGYVQSRLTARFHGVLGILITSIIFAAFHMDLVHSTAVFSLGVWLGWICWQSGSLFPAMLAHFINNAVSVFAVALGPEPGSDEVSLQLAGIMLAVFAIGTGSMFLTIFGAWRYREREGDEPFANALLAGPDAPPSTPSLSSPDALTSPS